MPMGRSCQRRYGDDELLPLSGIQHFEFCPRQWALIHIDQQWEENVDTTLGEIFHERAHLAGYSISHGVIAERSMGVASHVLGLVGYSDVVEFVPTSREDAVLRDGGRYELVPVEYKKGRHKASDCDRVQVVAQAMCLEEMYGTSVAKGCLFYGETRRREYVDVSDSLRAKVTSLAIRMHEIFESGSTPPVMLTSSCKKCSLTIACLPSASKCSARDYWRDLGVMLGEL